MDDLEALKTWHPVESGMTTWGGKTPRLNILPRAWTAIFLANLPACLIFGFRFTRDDARIGMIAAIALLLGLGIWACHSARLMARALILGAIPVGLTQLYPMLQIFIGTFGLEAARIVGGMAPTPPGGPASHDCINFMGGFVATLVTGGLLMTVALLLGLAFSTITPGSWWWYDPVEASPRGGPKAIPADLRDF